MGDLFRDGASWLAQQRAAHCASPITYCRGDDETEIDAAFGNTRYEVENEFGLRVSATAVDFLITAADFPYDEPLAGDQIVADGVTYEVMSLAGQGHWRWSDPFRTTLRIHVKETGA